MGQVLQTEKSKRLFERAIKVMVGGVNSPVRSFKSVNGEPRFISRGNGAFITDVDGNQYIDMLCSWGALILGHANPKVVEALQEYVANGTSYGAPTKVELELAELLTKALPSIEMIRMVNSGTEATMSAVRLARGYTGRGKIIKFEGCYHGHADQLLAKAGSGLATFSMPTSAGIPEETVRNTVILPYNDLEALQAAYKKIGQEVACAIIEPIAGNMGVIPANKEFLLSLHELAEKHGSLIIFDETITGFRVQYGGAQTLYKLKPDLTCLGKIIGGGLPVGAYGGRSEIMTRLAPLGPVYQAGTLAGNPLSMVAGLATLRQLTKAVYDRLEDTSGRLQNAISESLDESNANHIINRVGSMLGVFFTSLPAVTNYQEAETTDRSLYTRLFWRLLERGVYLPPSPFETIFLSAAHGRGEIQKVADAVRDSCSGGLNE
jgi:glutamate-1-semialdehyde 2,1-aminomutase